MSLLEDVFLENEAGEAQELERIIEGDEFDERPRKGHERDDLDLVLKKLEHWAYRLYPNPSTIINQQVQLTKIRLDLITSDDTVVQRDSSDDEAAPIPEPEDEFDKLLQQQIDIARATPAPGSANKAMGSANKAAGSVFSDAQRYIITVH
ncbi:Protein TIPIN-like protein [Operophtera brumata]|uniref:Protein TIPIN-like protein n=1 Tax=Operophtera brumata TaxID=104452 RepID=A0A0L7L4H5_OPEBR|nr:Protein TIPIN-like protein [Operophtera brumata]